MADTFTSSSQAPLDRTETGDQPYQFLNAAPSAWVEQGGFAKNIVDPSASNPMALVDVGSTNATVGGRFGYAPSQSGALYARVVDAQNWIRLRVDYFDCTTNAGTCYALVLETSRNGVLTQQGRRDLGNDGPSDIFLTLNGTSVSTAWIYNPGEGTNIGPAGTVSDFVGTTRHGIGAAASARPVGLGGFDYMSIQVS
ncbi:hypothetical protein ASF47_19420 [Nocardioides sp. Leaf285]|nr:hypothetical protein ASF47_19420 [Nocardioides sp. Leaf285]